MNDDAERAASPAFFWSRWCLGAVVAITLFSMMWVTFVDVVGRYVFNHPLQGAYELTELALAVLVFGALPLVTARNEHVTTALFDGFFLGQARRMKLLSVDLISGVACATLAWRLWIQAGITEAIGTESQVWHIPVGPFVYVMALTSAASMAILVWRAAETLKQIIVPSRDRA